MSSSLDVLVKNFSDNGFKYLSQKFNGHLLKVVKQKGVYPYKHTDSFEKFFEKQLPDRYKFYSFLKN